jgi:UDP-glucose 4-epimerase
MKNVLITGGAGFIGINLINKLKSKSNIYIIDLPKKINKNLNFLKDCKLIKKDITDKKTFEKLPKIKFDRVYHLAAKTSIRMGEENPDDCFKTNINGTKNLYEWCKIYKPKMLIFSSSMAVYGPISKNIREDDSCDPISFYGMSKLIGERILLKLINHNIKVRIFRLFNVYGPGQNFDNLVQGMLSIYLAQILKTKKVYVTGSLSRARDFIFIGDVINALISTKKKLDNNIFNIGSGKPTTVKSIINLLFNITKIKKKIFIQKGHSGDTNVSYANILKIKKSGWRCETSISSGIDKTIKNFYTKKL